MRIRVAFAAAGILTLAAWGQSNIFRSESRLVEVYATVFDSKNHPVDGIEKEHFQVFEDGARQEIRSFESASEELSCAILLDVTSSMRDALSGVKNAVSDLVDEMRPGDTTAIYGFSTTLQTMQEFTTDKSALKRAVSRARAQGETALFDAIAQTAREIESRPGKKAIVLFTDGADNASQLMAHDATRRVYQAGVPIFAVAEGKGTTVVDGKSIEWGVNDVFVVPPWKRYQHNVSGGDAVLFSISDRPAQEALGIWREGN